MLPSYYISEVKESVITSSYCLLLKKENMILTVDNLITLTVYYKDYNPQVDNL
jgi:hypothetical protein